MSQAAAPQRRRLLDDGKSLSEFILEQNNAGEAQSPLLRRQLLRRQVDPKRRRPTIGSSADVVQALESYQRDPKAHHTTEPLRVWIETYGCAMNVNDSEIVRSLLASHPNLYRVMDERQETVDQAHVVLVNTCAIREKAESRVIQRLQTLRALDRKREYPMEQRLTVGVLGCMAERMKTKLLDGMPSKRIADLVVGPDAYRDLPMLLHGLTATRNPSSFVYNVQLSLDETYADIAPLRTGNRVTGLISIMRGCDNHCAFCVVPQTRGSERSRDSSSIVDEVHRLGEAGYKEVILLGQNVNSYKFLRSSENIPAQTVYFAELLDAVCCAASPYSMRVRFTSPHPKDFPDRVLHVFKEHSSRILCRQLHIPLQSGSSQVLKQMRRGYTREEYLALIERVRETLGNETSISTDIITGFCGETELDHEQTLSLMRSVEYDQAFMFAYSERERTLAARNNIDDVPANVKSRRLREIIQTFQKHAEVRAKRLVGSVQQLLIDDCWRDATDHWTWSGRTEGNKRVSGTWSPSTTPEISSNLSPPFQQGDYICALIDKAQSTHMSGQWVPIENQQMLSLRNPDA